MKIDLHTHTAYSDGTIEPEELVQAAAKIEVTHLALTDHETTGGIEEARTFAAKFHITIIPAIEINTKENNSIHILGYFIDEQNKELQKILSRHREIRIERAQAIVNKFLHMGIKISLPETKHRNQTISVGRPHIADKLKEKGIVFTRQEAFDKFLGRGKPAYVPYEGPTPQEAIEMILSSNGLPVLAHPGYFVSEETIASLKKMGLEGIEVYYPSHTLDQIKNFLELSKQYDLIATGGSDYHGPNSGHESFGEIDIPPKIVDALLARKQKLFGK